MAVDFEAKWDGGPLKRGLDESADAMKKASKAAEQLGNEGAEAKGEFDKLEGQSKDTKEEIDALSKSAKTLSESFEGATLDAKALEAQEKATAESAKKLAEANNAAREKGERAKEGAEGLQKLFGLLGSVLGSTGVALVAFFFVVKEGTEGVLKLGKAVGALTFSGLIAGVTGVVAVTGPAIPIALALGAAIYGIAQAIIYFTSPAKELTDVIEANDKAFDDLHKNIDGVIPSLADMSNKTKELTDSLNAMFEPLDQHKNEVEIKLRIADLSTTDSIDGRLKQIRTTINEIAAQEAITSNEIAAKNEALAEAQKKYATEVAMLIERRKQLEEKAEADRLEAIEKRKAAEEKAFDEQTERQLESVHIDTENAKRRLEEIEKQKQAEITATKAAAEEKKKARQQEQTDAEANLKKALDGIKSQKAAESAPAPSSPTSSGEQKNPYGEGVAPTAGQGNDPYAAAANMDFGISTDFRGNENSYTARDTAAEQMNRPRGGWPQGGNSGGGGEGGDDPLENIIQDATASISKREVRNKALEERLKKLREQQAENDKAGLESIFGTSDGREVKGGDEQLKFNRHVEGQKERNKKEERKVINEFNKSGPTEDEKSDAADELLQERIKTAGKQAGLNDSLIEVLTKLAQKDKEEQQEIDQIKAQVQAITAAINLKGSTGNGTMPSRGQRSRAANP